MTELLHAKRVYVVTAPPALPARAPSSSSAASAAAVVNDDDVEQLAPSAAVAGAVGEDDGGVERLAAAVRELLAPLTFQVGEVREAPSLF